MLRCAAAARGARWTRSLHGGGPVPKLRTSNELNLLSSDYFNNEAYSPDSFKCFLTTSQCLRVMGASMTSARMKSLKTRPWMVVSFGTASRRARACRTATAAPRIIYLIVYWDRESERLRGTPRARSCG